MLTGKVDIERPRLLAAICASLVALLAIAQAGVWRLRADLNASPRTLVHARNDLLVALREAPTTTLGQATAADEIWIVGLVGCEGCDAATAAVIAGMDGADLASHVLLAPRSYPAPPEAALLVATVARSGDLGHFHAWRAGQPLPALVVDLAEAEGYGELARQSAGRLAAVLEANGMDATPPLVIWRRGSDWRAVSAARSETARHIRRDRADL